MNDIENAVKLGARLGLKVNWVVYKDRPFPFSWVEQDLISDDIAIGDFKSLKQSKYQDLISDDLILGDLESLHKAISKVAVTTIESKIFPFLEDRWFYQNRSLIGKKGEEYFLPVTRSHKFYQPQFVCEVDQDLVIRGVYLEGVDLKSIPKEVLNIKQLRSLLMVSCQLTDLKNLKKLKFLKHLDISANLFSKIPLDVVDSSIEVLVARNIGLEVITPDDVEVLKHCANLNTLDIQGNKIEEVPIELFQLERLWAGWDELLDLRKQKVEVVKKQHYEEAARIRDKEKAAELKFGGGLVLDKDKLKMPPPNIIDGKLDDIKFFIEKFKGKSHPINEVKLSVVGAGGSGKTSLVKQLMGKDYDPNESQTHGIRIESISLPFAGSDVKVNVWDFGGQDIMHSTHQFFLSKRSIYIIVADGRKGEDVEYWLNHVMSFGGGSPVLIVTTKVDENPGYHLNRPFLMEKYSNILGFYRISNLNRIGIEELVEGVKEGFKHVEHLSTLWTTGWLEVKRYLEQSSRNYIDFDQYLRICSERAVPKDEADVLVEYLNDLGSIIFFSDLPLKNTNVINPEWITNAVYSIINHKYLDAQQGVLFYRDLDIILDLVKYPKKKHDYIISLMLKFELCYVLNDKSVLIPALLGVEEPEQLPKPETKVVIKYGFLPQSIVSNLIVRFNKQILNDMKWRSGVVVAYGGDQASASIIMDQRERTITIAAEGKQRRELVSIIRFQLNDINSNFSQLDWEERLIVPNEPDISVSLNHLLRLEARGIEMVFPENAQQDYNVQELLGSIKPKREEVLQEIVNRLIELKVDINDRQKVEKELHEILILKPNFYGLGIDFNEILKLFNRQFKKK